MAKVLRNGLVISGSTATNVVTLTEAEYKALGEKTKTDNVLYAIKDLDEEGGGVNITPITEEEFEAETKDGIYFVEDDYDEPGFADFGKPGFTMLSDDTGITKESTSGLALPASEKNPNIAGSLGEKLEKTKANINHFANDSFETSSYTGDLNDINVNSCYAISNNNPNSPLINSRGFVETFIFGENNRNRLQRVTSFVDATPTTYERNGFDNGTGTTWREWSTLADTRWISGSNEIDSSTNKFTKFSQIPLTIGFHQYVVEESASDPDLDAPYQDNIYNYWWNVFQFGVPARLTQIAVCPYKITGMDMIYIRNRHDDSWSAWELIEKSTYGEHPTKDFLLLPDGKWYVTNMTMNFPQDSNKGKNGFVEKYSIREATTMRFVAYDSSFEAVTTKWGGNWTGWKIRNLI